MEVVNTHDTGIVSGKNYYCTTRQSVSCNARRQASRFFLASEHMREVTTLE